MHSESFRLKIPTCANFNKINLFQWCTFKHEETKCEIEWKYDPYNVTLGECSDFEDRAEFRVSIHIFLLKNFHIDAKGIK